MAKVRSLAIVVSLALGCAACSGAELQEESAASSSTTTDGEEAAQQPAATTGVTAIVPQPSTWQEFGQWSSPAMLVINDEETGQLATQHECFDGECGSDMDYYNADNVLVASGSTFQVRGDADTELEPTLRILSADLRFVSQQTLTARSGFVTLDLEEPGVYHLDVSGAIGFEDVAGLNRVRHHAWIQVVDPAAPCASDAGLTDIVTGVVDADGCPSSAATLNISSLHPHFHCNPWPASIELAGEPSKFFLRHAHFESDVEVVNAPSDIVSLDSFIPVGELHTSASDAEAVFVKRADSMFERWAIDPTGLGCA